MRINYFFIAACLFFNILKIQPLFYSLKVDYYSEEGVFIKSEEYNTNYLVSENYIKAKLISL